jgi:hypothetical protein
LGGTGPLTGGDSPIRFGVLFKEIPVEGWP